MAARLKVYATRIGFHEVIVAAPSQKAALAAWDIRDNLFADKAAGLVDDAAAEKAARNQPGVVLRRLAGSDDPWRPASAPSATPKLPRGAASKTTRKPPDRRPLDRAEAALDKAQAAAEALQARHDKARAELERAQAAERDRAGAAVDAARERLKAARAAWREAGGRP